MICTAHQILFGWSNQEEWDGQGMWHVWGTGEVYSGSWWGVWKKERPLKKPRRGWEDCINMDLQEVWIEVGHWLDESYAG